MAEGSNNLTTYYAKRIIGDNAAASPDKALLQTGTTITSDEWILNQTARYNESPSKKYGILYNYDSNGHDVIEFWGNKPDTNNNNNPIPSVSITLDSGNTEIMGTLDVVESTLLQSTLTVNNTSLFKNTVIIQMVSPTLILDSTASGAVDWTIKNNQGIFTIINSDNGSGTQILGNSVKGWQIDERLYINATIPDSPNYTLYVSGKTYVSGVSYLNGQVGIGYNPETSGNTHKLYVDGTTYLTDHLYIGRTNSSHIYLINKNWTKGTNPSSQTYSAIEYGSNDSTNNRVALLEATLDTSGNSQFNIFLVPNIANSTSWSGIVLKKDINDVLTINIGGTTTINGHLHLGAGKSIYFRYNDTDWPVLQNYDNSNITLNACGGGIHIGYINTPNTYIFYSNSSSAGTKFFEVNSDGSYALTRFGVNGQNTSYNFYVNGTSYFNGNTTHNGIDYFANGTTYYINNSANGYLNALQLKTNLTFDATGTTGTSGKITWSGSTDGADIYYYVPSSDQGNLIINTRDDTNCLVAFAYNGTIKAYINNSTPSFYPATTNTGNIGTSTSEWGTTYTRIIYARHFDASYPYTSDRNMYYGYNKADNHYFYTMDGTTRTHRATINATGLFINQPATNRNAGIIGSYDYTKAALIWSMGSNYNIAANGSGLGSLYGAAYGYQGQSYLGSNNYAGGHQFLWCQNGTVNVALGSNIWTSGNLYMKGDGIYYTGTKATYRMIRFIDNTSDNYGNGISIGGGGQTIIGGGESADTAAAQVGTSGSEIMYVCNDGDINLFANMQNGWSSRKAWTFGSNGYTYCPSYINIGGHEKNASSPTYVWGSNSSDNFLRSYQTSKLSVSYAASAGSAPTNANGTNRTLQIRYGSVTVNNNSNKAVTFSPAFSNACLMVVPFGVQLGFASYQSMNVGNVSKTGCTLYQFNQAGAACNMGYYAFGY